jgi:hypothetical protein
MDPEYSILKHRMEQHIGACGIPHNKLRLDTLTLLAEEAITQVRLPRSPFPLQPYLHY